MLYAAKCYWPSVTETNLEVVPERAVRTTASRDRVAYLDSLLFSADDLVLCFFEGPARTRRGARQRRHPHVNDSWTRSGSVPPGHPGRNAGMIHPASRP
jgi:hypothetical protein